MFPFRQIMIITSGVLVTAASCLASWTQFQGNAAHTGDVPGFIDPALISHRWSLNATDIAENASFTPGLASDDTQLFLTWRANATFNAVSSVDLKTGVLGWEWRFTGKDGETMSAPAYADGRVFVHRWGHSSSCGVDCHDKPRLFGIDAVNGVQLFDQTHAGQWFSGGRPTPEGDRVFVAGGYFGGLDAYNASTGQIEWFAGMPQEYGWIPAADQDYVYVSFNDTLTVLDRAGGTVQTIGTLSGPSYSSSTPVVAGQNEVYLPRHFRLTRINALDGQIAWTYSNHTVGNDGNLGAAVHGEAVYANLSGFLHAIDRQTGELLWKWVPGSLLTSYVVSVDHYLIVGTDSTTYIIDTLLHDAVASVPVGAVWLWWVRRCWFQGPIRCTPAWSRSPPPCW
ncbi:MAG: PQQ-binding-like beta-propeller repeat protein [Phycisphaerales bacterium]